MVSFIDGRVTTDDPDDHVCGCAKTSVDFSDEAVPRSSPTGRQVPRPRIETAARGSRIRSARLFPSSRSRACAPRRRPGRRGNGRPFPRARKTRRRPRAAAITKRRGAARAGPAGLGEGTGNCAARGEAPPSGLGAPPLGSPPARPTSAGPPSAITSPLATTRRASRLAARPRAGILSWSPSSTSRPAGATVSVGAW